MLTQSRQTIRRKLLIGLGLIASFGFFAPNATEAQQRYYPLDQSSPLGQYGAWSGFQQTPNYARLQPVRVELPSPGKVIFFSSARHRPLTFETAKSPAQAAIALGNVYRLEIGGMADNPGVSLYPTLELVDVLHPPVGREDEFPIAIQVTQEEIELAREGRLITKVVYLEPANQANPVTLEQPYPSLSIPPQLNVIEEADRRGRPMLIFRMGGRIPMSDEDPAFFGNGAPLSPFANPRTR